MASLTLTEWLGLLAILVTIIIALLTGIIKLILIITTRPKLLLNIGSYFSMDDPSKKKNNKKFRKKPVSTLIYSTKEKINSITVFMLPLLMINYSKQPIKNVDIILRYPSKYAIKEDEILGRNKTSYVTVSHEEVSIDIKRQVMIEQSIAIVSISIPLLRYKQPVCVNEAIKFSTLNKEEKVSKKEYFIGRNLAERLKKIKGMNDSCIIDMNIYSENCSPISRRVKLLWYNTDSKEEMYNYLDETVRKAFWCGKSAIPNLYGFFGLTPFKNLFNLEYCEVAFVKLKKLMSSDNLVYNIEDTEPHERHLFSFPIPSWNYYQLPNDQN